MSNSNRRSFLNILLGGSVATFFGSVFYPVAKFMNPPEVTEASVNSVIVGKIDDFAPNSGKLFKFGNSPGLLVRDAAGDFTAFEATCTHLDCTVQFNEEMGTIWCACHNGHYDLNGGNVSGPPPKPLTKYTVNINNDEVVVLKGE